MAQLEQLGIFADAPRSLLERLASESVEREFRPGEAIINQGEEADYLYVLLEGEVHVTSSGAQGGPVKLIRTMTAPAYFGEIGIVRGIPRTANVMTVRGCRCALISGASLLDALSIASASGSLIATTQSRLARTHPSPSSADHRAPSIF
ncbi:MAG: cyclic nucleotide-binding domain-containing protein [Solirubrobacteraceae bacterium]